MAGSTQYVPFATGAGALVIAPTTYATDSQLASGAQPGIARVDLNNTTLRQCSMVAAAITQFIANKLSMAINDDGNLTNLVTNLTNAIAALAQASVNLSGYAPLASPALTGNPTAPTPAAGDSSTTLATTAFVQANLDALAVPPMPKTANGIGQWVACDGTLPAGGTWAWVSYNDDDGGAGVSAGGSSMTSYGFCWRIQ